MPRIPRTVPALAWEQADLPWRAPAVAFVRVGAEKVVCYRSREGSLELCAFDIGAGQPLLRQSRLVRGAPVSSEAAFGPDGEVLVMEMIPTGAPASGFYGLVTIFAASVLDRQSRRFAQGLDPDRDSLFGLEVCGGVAAANVYSKGGWEGAKPHRPSLAIGVPLAGETREWIVEAGTLIGAAARVFVLKEWDGGGTQRLVTRSPGGEVLWRGAAAGTMAVGPRVVAGVETARGKPTVVAGLDPESGRELFRREIEGKLMMIRAGEASVAWVAAGREGKDGKGGKDGKDGRDGITVAAVDLGGEWMGSCRVSPARLDRPDPGVSCSLLAVDGNRVLIIKVEGGIQQISGWVLDAPVPLWSFDFPASVNIDAAAAIDDGFVVRLESGVLQAYRSSS